MDEFLERLKKAAQIVALAISIILYVIEQVRTHQNGVK